MFFPSRMGMGRRTSGFPDETLSGSNILTQPYDFTNAEWAKVVGTDTIVSGRGDPNGGTGAYKHTPGATSSLDHSFGDENVTVTAASHRFSVRCKANGYNYVELIIGSTNSYTKFYAALFNVSTGAFVSERNTTYTGTYSITEVGNGFYRCSINVTTDANSTHRCQIKTMSGTNPATPYSGDGSSGVDYWGAELYIP